MGFEPTITRCYKTIFPNKPCDSETRRVKEQPFNNNAPPRLLQSQNRRILYDKRQVPLKDLAKNLSIPALDLGEIKERVTKAIAEGVDFVTGPYSPRNSGGEKLWLAELPTTDTGDSCYRIKLKDKKLTADPNCSFTCEINLDNGKIIKKIFTK